jgi:hypothetical protein
MTRVPSLAEDGETAELHILVVAVLEDFEPVPLVALGGLDLKALELEAVHEYLPFLFVERLPVLAVAGTGDDSLGGGASECVFLHYIWFSSFLSAFKIVSCLCCQKER